MASNGAVPETAQGNAPTVLVVDDEPDVLRALEEVARVLFPGMQFAFADSAEKALGILEREPVVLLVTDFKMPGMNGTELIAAARRHRPGLSAIIITAFSDPRTFDMKRSGDGVEMLAKPFEPLEFAAIVRSLMGQRKEVA